MLGRGADLIVLSGDVTTSAEQGFLDRFMSKLGDLPIPTFIVPGNNEGPELATKGNVRDIDGKVELFEGLKFGGLGGSPPTPFNTPNEYTERQMEERLDKLGSVDILVSHSPPYGTSLDTSGYGGHLGSRAVLHYVETMKPKLLLCGHVHTAKSVEVIGSCTCCNPGSASAGGFAIVKIDGEVKVELRSL
jgi:Icc-related predicted phosphoesterase